LIRIIINVLAADYKADAKRRQCGVELILMSPPSTGGSYRPEADADS
jgi:hypothetical protein